MSEPKIKDGGPAFPSEPTYGGVQEGSAFPGMSLRDYFAGQALAGLLAMPREPLKVPTLDAGLEVFALSAYRMADAMLAEREKGQS